MSNHRATSNYPSCGLAERFLKLVMVRSRIGTQPKATGHDPVSEIAPLDEGVCRASDATDVCGWDR